MKFENRRVPEGVNYCREHPLKEFLWLVTAALLMVVFCVVLLSISVEYLVRFVPMETEVRFARVLENHLPGTTELDQRQSRIQAYLQQLSETLASAQEFPPGMDLKIHYKDDPLMNAFATLGGHIFIYRGLLEKLPHENALSMVLAHEIAHIQHRDPLVSAGRAAVYVLILSTLTGASDTGMLTDLFGPASSIMTLKFSRNQEVQADRMALMTLKKFYGHTQGAVALFKVLQQGEHSGHLPEFLNTHPLTEKRIELLDRITGVQDVSGVKPLTPLPKFFLNPGDRTRND